jgi:3-hexulose-6-phosphate synthase/6-phospho-3-hexuloisomerase
MASRRDDDRFFELRMMRDGRAERHVTILQLHGPVENLLVRHSIAIIMWPALQIALDLMQLNRAVEISEEAVKGGADWIEVGTPLIKSEGAEAVRTLRRKYPNRKIVADTKTMDVGSFEVEIMAKAGADVITVLGLADDSTVEEAVMAARKYGAEVEVDMINVPDKLERSKQVEKLGASYICLHMGIDEQMKGKEPPVDVLKKVVNATSIPVAVAGGITAENAGEYVQAGASIIIVGGGIIKTQNITAAAKAVKDAMAGKEIQHTDLAKKYGENDLFEAFARVSTCNISDAYHKQGIILGLHPYIKHNQRMVGRALTVQTTNGDWAKPVEAIDHAQKGDVLVIDVGGAPVAVWGELATNSAMMMGAVGIVIDGAIRDIDDIEELGFPAFARTAVPNAGEPKGYGGIGIEIKVGGQTVRTGDWIIGDESGLIVVPKEKAVEVANRALDVHERENRTREEIRRGSTLSKVNELAKWEPVK